MRPFRYKADLLATFLFVFSPLPMPCNYQTKAKTQFPLPEYPQEGKFKDAIQYETAVTRFKWIVHMFWHSVMSGLIMSKLWTLLMLVRLPICRWRLISGDERQRR